MLADKTIQGIRGVSECMDMQAFHITHDIETGDLGLRSQLARSRFDGARCDLDVQES